MPILSAPSLHLKNLFSVFFPPVPLIFPAPLIFLFLLSFYLNLFFHPEDELYQSLICNHSHNRTSAIKLITYPVYCYTITIPC